MLNTGITDIFFSKSTTKHSKLISFQSYLKLLRTLNTYLRAYLC